MPPRLAITSVEFVKYKALADFSLRLAPMSILVGPNNCGKSTIIGAFRMLALGLRRARARRAESVVGPEGLRAGWKISDDELPISLENVHTNYEDSDSIVEFRTSNGGVLSLYFPATGGCTFFADAQGGPIRSPAGLAEALPLDIQVVPVLGPVEHQEPLVTEETVRKNLATTRASRNFRNFWRYQASEFASFSELVRRTWPGMEILEPERLGSTLAMLCLEKRISRELYWVGFGFQIWCQLLTHICRCSNATLVVIDEPEIYLHPDVQRQLLAILRDQGPDVLLATHSTEIMSEADPSEIVLIDKEKKAAERLRDVEGVQAALDAIGSVQNITLTRLARNRRILFVEGESDFRLIRRFARKCGLQELAAGTELTPLEGGGFSFWEQIRALASGFESALGAKIHVGAIFDRDYWCDAHVTEILADLERHLEFAHIHERKELENYLLVPAVLDRALEKALSERARRTGKRQKRTESIEELLKKVSRKIKGRIQAQYITKRQEFMRRSRRDQASIADEAISIFDARWEDVANRMTIVPGKEVLAGLRTELAGNFAVNLTDHRIVSEFKEEEIPSDLRRMLTRLEQYRCGS